MNFNLKKSLIWPAVKWEKFSFLKYFKLFFLIGFLSSFFIFILGFLSYTLKEDLLRRLLSFSLIFFSLFCFSKVAEIFYENKVKNPQTGKIDKKRENLADYLSFEVAKIIFKSRKRNSTYFFLTFLKNNLKVKFIFSRMGLSVKDLEKEIFNYLEKGENFEKVILKSLDIAIERGHSKIEIGDFLIALSLIDPFFKKVLVESRVKTEDFRDLIGWTENVFSKKLRFWQKEYLRKKETLAKQWTAGYTVTLDKYSSDITERVKKSSPKFFGDQKEIKRIENILAKSENNSVLLVGESGTSRKSIIEHLAQKSLFGECKDELNFKRILELDLNILTAEIKNNEDLEFTLNEIFQEAVEAENIILVINNFHNYVGKKSILGGIDISVILSSFLPIPSFRLIAITDYEGLRRNIEKDNALLSFFEKVEVSPKDSKDTLKILLSQVGFFEKKQRTFISFQAIKQIVEMTDKYFPALPFPEKAMSIFDEVFTTYSKEKIILPKHVARIITKKSNIPVDEIEKKEKDILLNLEELIHQRLINQDQAVKDIAASLKRARSGISAKKGPMGSFLFLGPTGVGKTETAKALAQIYFGSENKMIRIDMSEFQEISDIKRLIGSETEPGFLTSQVKENPFSLVLLDELEKANLNILNLFLQVLDEGYLTDGFRRKISFENTIIIATSNAGYKLILGAIDKKDDWDNLKKEIFDYLFQEGVFKPEFINRFDSAIVFKPLSKENLLDISQLMLEKTKKKLEEKGIKLIIGQALREKIVDLSYNPVFGAREMNRVIQDKVENILSTALLKDELKKGDTVVLDENFNLKINEN